MIPIITLVAIVLVPIVILMLLRINAALVFLSLCLGNVLVQFVAEDASTIATNFSTQMSSTVDTSGNNVKIALLVLPVILTALFMIRTVKGKGRLLLNILPAAGVGMLGGLLVVPLLPAELSQSITDSSIWSQAQQAQNIIVGASAIICLLVLWLQRPKSGHHGGEEKHSKHKG